MRDLPLEALGLAPAQPHQPSPSAASAAADATQTDMSNASRGNGLAAAAADIIAAVAARPPRELERGEMAFCALIRLTHAFGQRAVDGPETDTSLSTTASQRSCSAKSAPVSPPSGQTLSTTIANKSRTLNPFPLSPTKNLSLLSALLEWVLVFPFTAIRMTQQVCHMFLCHAVANCQRRRLTSFSPTPLPPSS